MDILFCVAHSTEQQQYAEEKGVELIYVPVRLEAYVFFVNENNPVDNLTADQIRGIYTNEQHKNRGVSFESPQRNYHNTAHMASQ